MKASDVLKPQSWCACVFGALAALLPTFVMASSVHTEPGHGMVRNNSALVGEDWHERVLPKEAVTPYQRIVGEQDVVSIVPAYHNRNDDDPVEYRCVHANGRYSSNRPRALRQGRIESACDPVESVSEVAPLSSLALLPLTDIYDITLIELPEEPATPAPGGGRSLILPGSVANDGTVAATRKIFIGSDIRHKLVRLRPGSMNWESLASSLNVMQNPIISPDGSSILFTGFAPRQPAIFRDGAFNYLPNLVYNSEALGASDDFSHFAGIGYRPDPDPEETSLWIAAWAWGAEDGQVDLPVLLPWPRPYTPLTYRLRDRWLPPDTAFTSPYAKIISNDGQRVFGKLDLVSREIPGWDNGAWDLNGNFGIYWQDGKGMRVIRGQNREYLGNPLACDANCDIVFGNGYWRKYDYHLRGQTDHAWYWKPATGESGSLGALNPTEENPEGWAYSLFDVSGDGTLAIGIYHSPDMAGGLPNGARAYDGLIWSQATGFVLLSDLLAETGQSLDWPAVYAHRISSNGEYILLSTGEVASGQVGVPPSAKMALLRLTPKAP